MSFLLFSIKCAIIIYFTACTGTGAFTSAISATPLVTKNNWSVQLLTETSINNKASADSYILIFKPSGKITAIKINKVITGNWSEDNILKSITIYLKTEEPALAKLNNDWIMANISKTAISFQCTKNNIYSRLLLTSL